ncbi:hypothetical protein [Streptomyces sp. NPDC018031]|uniref:hypothetical protein n=1 Tax=Streptomyces sp. NPDC018031 TaxID=3365033 RepID=UPI0037B5A063
MGHPPMVASRAGAPGRAEAAGTRTVAPGGHSADARADRAHQVDRVDRSGHPRPRHPRDGTAGAHGTERVSDDAGPGVRPAGAGAPTHRQGATTP